jgi:hypothetical protein
MAERGFSFADLAREARVDLKGLHRIAEGKQIGFRDGGDKRLEDALGLARGTLRDEWAKWKPRERRAGA